MNEVEDSIRYDVGIVVHYFSKDESKIHFSSYILNPSDPETSKSIQCFLELISEVAYLVIMCRCHSVSGVACATLWRVGWTTDCDQFADPSQCHHPSILRQQL